MLPHTHTRLTTCALKNWTIHWYFFPTKNTLEQQTLACTKLASPAHAVNHQVIDHAIKVWRAQMGFLQWFWLIDWMCRRSWITSPAPRLCLGASGGDPTVNLPVQELLNTLYLLKHLCTAVQVIFFTNILTICVQLFFLTISTTWMSPVPTVNKFILVILVDNFYSFHLSPAFCNCNNKTHIWRCDKKMSLSCTQLSEQNKENFCSLMVTWLE